MKRILQALLAAWHAMWLPGDFRPDGSRESEVDDMSESTLMQCQGCGEAAETWELDTCYGCGKVMHKTCMDKLPEWLTDDVYVCSDPCRLHELEKHLAASRYHSEEEIDLIGREIEKISIRRLPEDVSTVLVSLDALRQVLQENEQTDAMRIVNASMALIRQLAHRKAG